MRCVCMCVFDYTIILWKEKGTACAEDAEYRYVLVETYSISNQIFLLPVVRYTGMSCHVPNDVCLWCCRFFVYDVT